MGGNAGTQTLAVAVRALATNQLTESNTLAHVVRELTIALANGLSLGAADRRRRGAHLRATRCSALVIGAGDGDQQSGRRAWRDPGPGRRSTGFEIDPAVSSAVFVTTITDVIGFFSFLGLAALFGLGR